MLPPKAGAFCCVPVSSGAALFCRAQVLSCKHAAELQPSLLRLHWETKTWSCKCRMTPGWTRGPTRAARRRKCCAFSTPHLRNLRLIGRIVVGFFQFAIELSTFTAELIALCKVCTFHLPGLHKHTIFPLILYLFFFFLIRMLFSTFPQKAFFENPKSNKKPE